ncbi:Iron-sulfur cluster carrier protein [invertebrate metagenome]|uniref:Iron-sulfur cluster carrier protein n=1 Tax=invertebrate metagenome TaxID=1711999 RepID=A0A2H9TAW2_9ZZZZ
MGELNRVQLEAVLQSCQDPYLKKDLITAGCTKTLEISNGQVSVEVVLGYPADGLTRGLTETLKNQLEAVNGVKQAKVNVTWSVSEAPVQKKLENMAGVKNIVAVASGKGGVGKSTTTANLALAMSAEGARVGVLDADIYGPSMGLMFGIPDGQKPEVKNDQFFLPVESYGLQLMSMAFLMTEATPAVWRGPMASGALQQLLTQTIWNDLDYLFIDMPPGTGDIQLTLAQSIPVTGSVIVTTPQDLALLDAVKGIEMFQKVDIPTLGVVENMAVHICSQCGHTEHLFGEGGGKRIADHYGVDLLGSLPLSMMIREQADGGKPTVVAEPESQMSMIYRDMARRIGANLFTRSQKKSTVPVFSMSDD